MLCIVVSISSGFIPAARTANLFEVLTLPNQLSIWTPNVLEVAGDDEDEACTVSTLGSVRIPKRSDQHAWLLLRCAGDARVPPRSWLRRACLSLLLRCADSNMPLHSWRLRFTGARVSHSWLDTRVLLRIHRYLSVADAYARASPLID